MKKLVLLTLAGLVLTACGESEAGDSEKETTDLSDETELLAETVVEDESDTDDAGGDDQTVEVEVVKEVEPLQDFTYKRDRTFDAVEAFLDVTLNYDSRDRADEDKRMRRREELAPYVTADVLRYHEPTNEELEEDGFIIPSENEEYDETVSPRTNLEEMTYELEMFKVYIDESTIETDKIEVIADAVYIYETDFEGDVSEQTLLSYYKFALELGEEDWVISEHDIMNTGNAGADYRSGSQDFYK